MVKKIFIFIFLVTGISLSGMNGFEGSTFSYGILTPKIVAAEDAADPATDGIPEVNDPAYDCSTGSKVAGDCDLVAKYINPMITFLSVFVGIAVTVGIVYGAIEYTSAGSDPGKVQKARGHIRNSIIALIVFLFLWALLGWLNPGGL